MIGATDRLSRCASALLHAVERRVWANREMDAISAPGALRQIVHASIEDDVARILEEHAYTPRAFANELEARTCPRFVRHEFGNVILALMPEDDGPDADRLACCASELLYLARCEYELALSGEPDRAGIESEALEIVARHGFTRDELVRSLLARAHTAGEPEAPWYLSVLPRSGHAPAIASCRSPRASHEREFVVTVGCWEGIESYKLGTIDVRAATADEARRRGVELLFRQRSLDDAARPWALAETRDARREDDARPIERKYLVTVGWVTEQGERAILGTLQLHAPSAARAREAAIDALFDERLRTAGCAPWARAERLGA